MQSIQRSIAATHKVSRQRLVGLVVTLAFLVAPSVVASSDLADDRQPTSMPTAVGDGHGTAAANIDDRTAPSPVTPAHGPRRSALNPPHGPFSVECEHPYPCEAVWPDELDGPFELDRVDRVMVESHDGVQLEGWIGIPDLPEGVRAPVALHSSPYLGVCLLSAARCIPGPAADSFWSDAPGPDPIRTWGVAPIELVRHGYAAAFFSLRGTGGSGGCGDVIGPAEQADQVALVDWLASRDWSNGRVGMGGNSFPGTTPWEAAIHEPEGLKTIVTAGILSDLYTFVHTPQGALNPAPAVRLDELFAQNSLVPHLGNGLGSAAQAVMAPERVCPDQLAPLLEGHRGHVAEHRDPSVWLPRRLIDGFPDVTASVLLAHGFQDIGQAFQDDVVWAATPNAPKWQITGQWGHGPPFATEPAATPGWIEENWRGHLFGWLDYWLKGMGQPPALDQVDWQDSSGDWHHSTEWPPREADSEALYLAGTTLSPEPGNGDRRFVAASSVHNDHSGAEEGGLPGALMPPCRKTTPELDALGAAWVSAPVEERTVLAGSPLAFLSATSSEPGGGFAVQLVRIPAGSTCEDLDASLDLLSMGAVDLRFRDGNYASSPFPVGTPTPVRVDLFDIAEVLEAGDRLAVVVSGPERHTPQGHHIPHITINAGRAVTASHVVVPVVSGGFRGSSTGIRYPPRPFVPTESPSGSVP